MKASVYIATTLDGYIARPDGALDWLPGSGEAEGASEVEEHGWAAFWDSVDCLVLGRNTFEKVLELSPDLWPYEGKRVIVLSRTLTAVPEELEGKVDLYAGDPGALVEKLAEEGHERLYVDGGVVIQSFLRQGLITDISITTIPVLIGEGIPLFGPLEEDILLKHVETKTYTSGFVQSTYEV